MYIVAKLENKRDVDYRKILLVFFGGGYCNFEF